ncbi:HP1 family phage holin [Yokenella regensburgei]|uniref:HP1 family phage holin n=1 Tax=Yokenella regensburgei TaxID=158877 RepID=UPI003ED8E148
MALNMHKYSSHASFIVAWIVTLAGALTLQDWEVIIGIILGIGTFSVNLYYKRKLVDALVKNKKNLDQDIYSAMDD